MASKQQMQEEIDQLRERVAVLEAELTTHRSVHQFVITTPVIPPSFPQWYQQHPYPVTCGSGVDSVLATGI